MRRLLRWNVAQLLFAIFFLYMPHAQAYPILDAVAGLPNPELITVYPDDADPNLYYFVPTTISLVFDPVTGKPRLGVQYWGLTGVSPFGVGAALTLSIKPGYDKPTVDRVADGLKKKNPNSSFAFPTLVDSSMDLILNGNYYQNKQDTTKPAIKGGTVDATQAFTIGLSGVGAAAFAQGVAPDTDVLAARYTFKFSGIAKRLHARITVFDKHVYDHFKATASTSSWWGLVTTSWSADWQKLVNDGWIKIDILEGGETDKDAYMLEVFKSIVNAKIGETGMFSPKLKPGGITGGGGSAPIGWGFSGGGGWEHLDESTNYVFEINTKKLEEREFSVGLSFSAVCAKYPTNFVDLTTLGNNCIDTNKFLNTVKEEQKCISDQTIFYSGLLKQKLITQAQYDAKVDAILRVPCGSSGGGYSPAMLAIAPSALQLQRQCINTRLSLLQNEYKAGTMPPQQLGSLQQLSMDIPCAPSKSGEDFIAKALRDTKATLSENASRSAR